MSVPGLLRAQNVHTVIRKNETARAGIDGDGYRNRAHARHQLGRHESGSVRMYDFCGGQRLSGHHRRTNNGALNNLGNVRRGFAGDESGINRCPRPFLPAYRSRLQRRPRRKVAGCDEYAAHHDLRTGRCNGLWRTAAQKTARKKRHCSGRDCGYGEYDYTCSVHGIELLDGPIQHETF